MERELIICRQRFPPSAATPNSAGHRSPFHHGSTTASSVKDRLYNNAIERSGAAQPLPAPRGARIRRGWEQDEAGRRARGRRQNRLGRQAGRSTHPYSARRAWSTACVLCTCPPACALEVAATAAAAAAAAACCSSCASWYCAFCACCAWSSAAFADKLRYKQANKQRGSGQSIDVKYQRETQP